MKHYNDIPTFVTDFPRDLKPFYARTNQDGQTVSELPENLNITSHLFPLQTSSLDLLVPHVGELAGGTLREERLDKLTNRLRELEMSEEHYGWLACNIVYMRKIHRCI